MKDFILKIILGMTQSLTSKKFINTIYVESWAFLLLAIYMLGKGAVPAETIINAFLMFIGTVFATFVGGNVVGDHMQKKVKIVDKDNNDNNNIKGE